MMDRTAIALIAIAAGVAVTSTAVLFLPYTASSETRIDPELLRLPNANLTDDQLIQKTHDLEQIKALLNKYPDAKVTGVARLYETKPDARNIGVVYEVDRKIAYVNGTFEQRQLAVGVNFDRYSNKMLDVKFSCYAGSGPFVLLRTGVATTADIQNSACFK